MDKTWHLNMLTGPHRKLRELLVHTAALQRSCNSLDHVLHFPQLAPNNIKDAALPTAVRHCIGNWVCSCHDSPADLMECKVLDIVAGHQEASILNIATVFVALCYQLMQLIIWRKHQPLVLFTNVTAKPSNKTGMVILPSKSVVPVILYKSIKI